MVAFLTPGWCLRRAASPVPSALAAPGFMVYANGRNLSVSPGAAAVGVMTGTFRLADSGNMTPALERQATDPAGGVDLVARELGPDQPVLAPVYEQPRHRHDHAEPHLVPRQLRADGRGRGQAREQHGDESPDRPTPDPDHVSLSSHASDSANRSNSVTCI